MRHSLYDINGDDNQAQYIELPEWTQSRISDNLQTQYDGKFSLDIEKQNKKIVIKYILGFLVISVLLIIFIISQTRTIDEPAQDDNQFVEVQVDEKGLKDISEEIEPQYHQGCVKQQDQEWSCRSCIYQSNIQQNSDQKCESCCYSCLPSYFYLPQRYCMFEFISVYVSLRGIISNQSTLPIPDQDYSEENIMVDRLIKVIQQTSDWKSIQITYSYGSLYVSQINFFKEILRYLAKVLSLLGSQFEQFELIAGPIQVKDDIYKKPIQYDTQFLYNEVLKNLKVDNLKKIVLNLSFQNQIYTDRILNNFMNLIARSTKIELISFLMNKFSTGLQNFTQNSFRQFTTIVKNSLTLKEIHLQFSKQIDDVEEQFLDLISEIEELSEVRVLYLSLNLKNTSLYHQVLEKINEITQLTILKIDFSYISFKSSDLLLPGLSNLNQMYIAFYNPISINSNLFDSLNSSSNLQVFSLSLHNSFNNQNSIILQDTLLIQIGKLMSQLNSLDNLQLEFQCKDEFTDQGIQQFIESLSSSSQNIKIFQFISQNTQLTDQGFMLISSYFAKAFNLQTVQIELQNNQNISYDSFRSLTRNLSNKQNITSIILNIRSSSQILSDNRNFTKQDMGFLTFLSKLNTLHLSINKISQQQIIDFFELVKSTNITNIKIVAMKYQDQPKLYQNVTDLKELKFNQNLIYFHLEILNQTSIIGDDFCTYITFPLLRQIRMEYYTNYIGCEFNHTQFDSFVKIQQNLKSDRNIIIKKDQFLNITDEQFLSLFQYSDNPFKYSRVLSLDLRDQLFLNESSINKYHNKLNYTVNYYSLVTPSNIQLSQYFMRNISHFCAYQYNLKSFKLEVPQLVYSIESIQTLVHSISLSINKLQNQLELNIPCNLTVSEISQMGPSFSIFNSFLLQLNQCKYNITQEQINQLNLSYSNSTVQYNNNDLKIKKSLSLTQKQDSE